MCFALVATVVSHFVQPKKMLNPSLRFKHPVPHFVQNRWLNAMFSAGYGPLFK